MTEEKDRKPFKKVGAVAQAFSLLRVLSSADRPLGVTALARSAGVNPSTAFNILRTLVLEDAATFDERAKTYRLSPGLLDLCGTLAPRSIGDAIRGDLERIADETSCLTGLWQAVDGKMVLVQRAVGKSPLRLDMQIHQKLPRFAGAVGRAHVAALRLSEAELRTGFAESRWEGSIDADRYVAEVRQAERNGYAIDDGMLHSGVVTVASVILGSDGTVTHGLTVSDIAHRLDGERIHALGREMRDLGSRFSEPTAGDQILDKE